MKTLKSDSNHRTIGDIPAMLAFYNTIAAQIGGANPTVTAFALKE
jgi:hypothetical protein